MSDDEMLARALISDDPALRDLARIMLAKRDAGLPRISEPPHCAECFEGCPKCEPREEKQGLCLTFDQARGMTEPPKRRS